jgi:hypothetical protein
MSNIADEIRASKFCAETGDTRHAIDPVNGVSLPTTRTRGQYSLLLTPPLEVSSSSEWQLLPGSSLDRPPKHEAPSSVIYVVLDTDTWSVAREKPCHMLRTFEVLPLDQ